MPTWQLILIACAVAVTVALVLLLLGLTRAVRRAEGVLAIVEQELRPLVGQVNGLTDDVRALIRHASGEVERLGVITDQLGQVTGALARVATGLAGLARVGSLVGLAAGIRRGVDVFARHLRQGDHHG